MVETNDYLEQREVETAWKSLHAVTDAFIARQTATDRAKVAAALMAEAKRWNPAEQGEGTGDE